MGSARISQESDAIIEEIINETGKSKIVVIEEALKLYRFRERMRLFNESYERLRSDKKLWNQELKVREDLDGTLNDGLEDE